MTIKGILGFHYVFSTFFAASQTCTININENTVHFKISKLHLAGCKHERRVSLLCENKQYWNNILNVGV